MEYGLLLIETRIADKEICCKRMDNLEELKDSKGELAQHIFNWYESYVKIKKGDKYIHYKFEDGTTFDSSFNYNRINFRNKLYPELMMQSINEYLKTHKVK